MPAKSKKQAPSNTQFESPNLFGSLKPDIETKEKAEHREAKSAFHLVVDKIWKKLVSNRQECRSLQYQLLAAIFIEKEGIENEDGGLEELIESILIDPRMGDQHGAKLPPEYREKAILCTNKIFIEDKSIAADVNKFLAFLRKWHKDLEEEIKTKLGDNYKIKVGLNQDGSDKYIINPELRIQIKEIIINNAEAKKLRDEFGLSARPLETKETPKEIKPKTGLDHYLDYLLTEDEVRAAESLNEAVRLGYVEDESENKKQGAVVCDEYYIKKFKECYDAKKYQLLEKMLLNGAKKKSSIAMHLLSEVYELGIGITTPNPTKAGIFCKLAAAQNFLPSKHNLAYNYLGGLCGIKKDVVGAIRLFREIAEQGYVDSQITLGGMYVGAYKDEVGELVEEDIGEAIKWYRLAADQGDELRKF